LQGRQPHRNNATEAIAATDNHSKVNPLSTLGQLTPATMLNSLKLCVGSLTHEAKGEPLKFRDLMGTKAVFLLVESI